MVFTPGPGCSKGNLEFKVKRSINFAGVKMLFTSSVRSTLEINACIIQMSTRKKAEDTCYQINLKLLHKTFREREKKKTPKDPWKRMKYFLFSRQLYCAVLSFRTKIQKREIFLFIIVE